MKFDNRAIIGRGSILFRPFLDINGDGKRNKTEPSIEGVNIHPVGGGLKERLPGGSTTVSGLEPYIAYHFKLDSRNLERIAWQIEDKTMNIFVNPNQIKVVEIPVKVVGEISGFIYKSGEGIGGIKINIFDTEENLLTTILSEADGYFGYLGLSSGSYEARVDAFQLERLNLEVEDELKFGIKNAHEGDYVDDLEIFLFPGSK